jgi:hypothetical protein
LKIPRKIRIIGRDFAVIRDHENMLHEGCYGTIEYDENIIRLRERKPYFSEHQEAQTLMHELVHAIDFSIGIKLEEDQINRLTVGIMAVIRDNDLDFRKCKDEPC